MSTDDDLYDEMRREERHAGELGPHWECAACGVTIMAWDMPHEHLCYATGYTRTVRNP